MRYYDASLPACRTLVLRSGIGVASSSALALLCGLYSGERAYKKLEHRRRRRCYNQVIRTRMWRIFLCVCLKHIVASRCCMCKSRACARSESQHSRMVKYACSVYVSNISAQTGVAARVPEGSVLLCLCVCSIYGPDERRALLLNHKSPKRGRRPRRGGLFCAGHSKFLRLTRKCHAIVLPAGLVRERTCTM